MTTKPKNVKIPPQKSFSKNPHCSFFYFLFFVVVAVDLLEVNAA